MNKKKKPFWDISDWCWNFDYLYVLKIYNQTIYYKQIYFLLLLNIII